MAFDDYEDARRLLAEKQKYVNPTLPPENSQEYKDLELNARLRNGTAERQEGNVGLDKLQRYAEWIRQADEKEQRARVTGNLDHQESPGEFFTKMNREAFQREQNKPSIEERLDKLETLVRQLVEQRLET